MADMFLMLQDIEGESLDAVHTNQIEILDMGWNNKHVVHRTRKDEKTSTKPDIGDITIKKICDKASANLLKYCCLGKKIPHGKITFRKHAGESKVEYLTIDLWDIKVSSFNWNWEVEGGLLHETVELNIAKFHEVYTLQDNSGLPGGTVPFGFDIPHNVEFP